MTDITAAGTFPLGDRTVNRLMGRVHGPSEGPSEEPFTALAELQRQGLIRHLGVSNVTSAQVAQACGIAEVVCVHNL